MATLTSGRAIRAFAVLVAGCAVGLSATTISQPSPSPSAAPRTFDTPVVDHIAGGGPDGGAVHSLAVAATRPATLFASFERGGVYKSRDGGATWIPADRGLPGDGSCDLVAVPAHSSTLYAACGDGLFKTTSGGALWQQLDLDNPVAPAVAPSDPRVVYQRPSYGVVRSRDGGRRWEQMHGPTHANCYFAFAVDPVDPFTLFCGGDEWMEVSRDGGITWTSTGRAPDSDADISALAIDPSDRHTIIAGTSDGRTFKTRDGGSTWFHAGDGPLMGTISDLEFVGKAGDILFATQGSGILRSLDAGNHWQLMPFAGAADPLFVFVVDPFSPSTVYVGTRDGVMVTTDFGEHWARRRRGISRAEVSVALYEGTVPTLYATTGRELFTSRNSGDTWTASGQAAAFADSNIFSLTSDGASGVLAQTASGVFRLRRGESAWSPFVPPFDSGSGSTPRSSADGTLFAIKDDGFAFSVDGGRRWSWGRVPGTQTLSSIAIAAGQPRIIYASTGNILGDFFGGFLGQSAIWRSLDEGKTWQLLDQPSDSIGRCCSLQVDPYDRNIVYATAGGVVIRRTTDGGLTWIEMKLPALSSSLTLIQTAPTTLLAQVYDPTDAGRFVLVKSTDRGEQWTRAGAGLPPNVEITNIVSDVRRPNHLFAGTYGRGVFRSVDGGDTWRPTGSVR